MRTKITKKNRPLYIEEIITTCAICGGLFGEDELTEGLCENCQNDVNNEELIGYRIDE